ncbi:DinB family protein [Xylanimonas oleitrophica]|uniref:DinB family protein n=1 Tax=Xylanimonas oleitrophica TaxID=2607479 RepID=A0A2W5XTM9_9MICO|nr:DinB family protein [Xylanimonas oleitrophica]PZR53458.1 DinB family protein [Xylanimonas oleitrophica]
MQRDGIEPDTKDWTWVLERPCPECGFSAAGIEPHAVGDAVRATLPRWRTALTRADVATRPAAGVWSPLEYGAHVRDVFRVFDTRLAAMLQQHDPLFDDWDQDAAALADGYAHQDPTVVAGELEEAGAAVAARFDTVGPDDAERPGRRSNGSVFTVRTLGRYFLHDVVHHLHDVRA